ncbi:hypothetical protein QJS04_geneDACA010837 [Acorus gramineus]|uniref:Uncharacterized protein n=1 Tax=Acorus gramineus TaxID=55184 RepID=A0AAV9B8W9_ACOGR|nr:hypothetical protein QJS04_geneDACA010837 [Acorus gramineus]
MAGENGAYSCDESLLTLKCTDWQLCLSRFSAIPRRRKGQILLARLRDLTQATQSKVDINGGVKTYKWCKVWKQKL